VGFVAAKLTNFTPGVALTGGARAVLAGHQSREFANGEYVAQAHTAPTHRQFDDLVAMPPFKRVDGHAGNLGRLAK
jgi:hypothetical protein